MAAYQLIASGSIGAGAPYTVTFSSIPQTFTDLKIVGSVRSTRTGTWEAGMGCAINGNTSTGYTYKILEWQGVNTGSQTSPYEPEWTQRIPATNATASVFGTFEIFIPNYTQTVIKNYIAYGGVANDSNQQAAITVTAFTQTATTAITSVVIRSEALNLAQYSNVYLYGITNA